MIDIDKTAIYKTEQALLSALRAVRHVRKRKDLNASWAKFVVPALSETSSVLHAYSELTCCPHHVELPETVEDAPLAASAVEEVPAPAATDEEAPASLPEAPVAPEEKPKRGRRKSAVQEEEGE